MKNVLYIILIPFISLTIISCSSSDDGASTTSDNTTTSDDDSTTDDTTTTTDTTSPVIAEYSGPHKWDNVLRCIFNQTKIPNGQENLYRVYECSKSVLIIPWDLPH